MRYYLLLALFFLLDPVVSHATFCGGIPTNGLNIVAVDAEYPPVSNYPIFNGTNIHSEGEVRDAAYSQAIGWYRSVHGANSAPIGSVLVLTYGDGSYECAMVTETTGTFMGAVIAGSQHEAGSGSGGDGGGEPLIYYFPPPTWMEICDDYYSDGVYEGSICEFEVA